MSLNPENTFPRVELCPAGSTATCVVVKLPRAVVETLLAQHITEYIRTAEILRFNHEHAQWDLMIGNLLTQVGAADIIKNCAAALAQSNDSNQPRGKS